MRNRRTIPHNDFIRTVASPIIKVLANRASSRVFERFGLHISPVGFYSPVPDTFALGNRPWDSSFPFDLLNVDLFSILEKYENMLNRFRPEVRGIHSATNPGYYKPNNGAFEGLDAEMLYMMIRSLRPRRIIEIGSGFSTCCMLDAICANREEDQSYRVEYTVYDPYPLDDLASIPDDLVDIRRVPAQEISLATLADLDRGDVFFIDSSHVVATGSDVSHLFLNILPRLPSGVVVHVHDIFLPSEYPKRWVSDWRLFWNEQYLLYALLLNDPCVQVVWPGHQMHLVASDRLRSISPTYDPSGSVPGSFWFSRHEIE